MASSAWIPSIFDVYIHLQRWPRSLRCWSTARWLGLRVRTPTESVDACLLRVLCVVK